MHEFLQPPSELVENNTDNDLFHEIDNNLFHEIESINYTDVPPNEWDLTYDPSSSLGENWENLKSVSPSQDFNNEKQVPKKRGRKPTKMKAPVEKKPRMYEMDPFLNKEAERRRLKAVCAKRRRNVTKEKITYLEERLDRVTGERDELLKINDQKEKMIICLCQALKHRNRFVVFHYLRKKLGPEHSE